MLGSKLRFAWNAQELTCCLAHWLWTGFSHTSFSPFLYPPVMYKEAASVGRPWDFWRIALFQKRKALSLNLKFQILLLRHPVIRQLVCCFIKHMGNHHLFYLGQGAAVGRSCQVFVSGFSYEQKLIGKWQVPEEKVSHKIKCSANLRTFNMVNIVPCTWISKQQRISRDGERMCSCCAKKYWEGSRWNSGIENLQWAWGIKDAPLLTHSGLWGLLSPSACLCHVPRGTWA